MSQLIEVHGKSPQLGEGSKVFETAVLTGDITTGKDCTFWFQSVARGDVNKITLGDKVNGCTIHDDVLIGMGAIVMDHAVIESGCLIAAGAVVTQGMHCKSGWIYAGLPAKPIKKLSPEMMKGEVERIADAYVMYAGWYA